MHQIVTFIRRSSRFLDRRFYLVLAILFVIAVAVMPYTAFPGDYWAFADWVRQIDKVGLMRVYDFPTANYWPPFMYLLGGMRLLFSNFDTFMQNIYYLKIPLVAFDFGSIAICAYILRRFKKSRYLALLILFNPAFFYDSYLWGQIESMYAFFALGAVTAAIFRKTNLSIILYVLAFYSKLQAVIFFPGLLLLLLPQFCKSPKLILEGLLVFIGTNLAVIFPFLYTGQAVNIFRNVFASVDLMPWITAHAGNFWILIFGQSADYASDAQDLGPMSFKAWGIVLFFTSSAVVLWQLFWSWLKKPRQLPEFDLDYVYKVLLINALIALLFFYFPTQMHERYLQPAILFFGLVFILKPGKLTGFIYVLISGCYFLNLEMIMNYFGIYKTQFPLPVINDIALGMTVVLLSALYLLFRKKSHKLLM